MVDGEVWVANNKNLTSTKALETLEKVGGWRVGTSPGWRIVTYLRSTGLGSGTCLDHKWVLCDGG